eukprot:scaffold1988_cov255-Pinguiococcus_pyrenoidosus.AAC.2
MGGVGASQSTGGDARRRLRDLTVRTPEQVRGRLVLHVARFRHVLQDLLPAVLGVLRREADERLLHLSFEHTAQHLALAVGGKRTEGGIPVIPVLPVNAGPVPRVAVLRGQIEARGRGRAVLAARRATHLKGTDGGGVAELRPCFRCSALACFVIDRGVDERGISVVRDVERGEAAHGSHAVHVDAVQSHVLQDAVRASGEAEAQDQRRHDHRQRFLSEKSSLVLEEPEECIPDKEGVAVIPPRVREIMRIRSDSKHELLRDFRMSIGLQLPADRRKVVRCVPRVRGRPARVPPAVRAGAVVTGGLRCVRQPHLCHQILRGERVEKRVVAIDVLATLPGGRHA